MMKSGREKSLPDFILFQIQIRRGVVACRAEPRRTRRDPLPPAYACEPRPDPRVSPSLNEYRYGKVPCVLIGLNETAYKHPLNLVPAAPVSMRPRVRKVRRF
jgi:hypothetical protein